MAKERTSVSMQAQIKTLSEQGHSIRRLARILSLSRRTVRKFLEPTPEPAGKEKGVRNRFPPRLPHTVPGIPSRNSTLR